MTHLGAKSVAEYSKLKFEETMAKQKKQTLNEEQIAQGIKESGKFQHQIWKITPKYDPTVRTKTPRNMEPVYVESAKWFDAKTFGEKFYGTSEVNSERVPEEEKKPLPRYQLRWAGNAANSPNTLRLQCRYVVVESIQPEERWTDVGR